MACDPTPALAKPVDVAALRRVVAGLRAVGAA